MHENVQPNENDLNTKSADEDGQNVQFEMELEHFAKREEDNEEASDYGEDEEELEIEQMLRRPSQHFVHFGQKLSQSCSAYANLGTLPSHQGKLKRKDHFDGSQKQQQHLETSAEEDEYGEGEDMDSDEELFAAHTSLLPLRKSKSAFAGFNSPSIKSTKPFECPVIVKGNLGLGQNQRQGKIDEDNDDGDGSNLEIAEVIDLRRGDVLEFRISHHPDERQHLPICASPAAEDLMGPNERTMSCWSAPACPNESEGEISSSEDSDGGYGFDGEFGDIRPSSRRDGKRRKRHSLDLMENTRKGSSWSAPCRFEQPNGEFTLYVPELEHVKCVTYDKNEEEEEIIVPNDAIGKKGPDEVVNFGEEDHEEGGYGQEGDCDENFQDIISN